MKYTWTLVILIFLGSYEAELLCQIAPDGPSKYVTFANQELDKARKACDAGDFEQAKVGFDVAIDFLKMGKAEYQQLEGEEASVKKMDELIAAAEKELEDCLKKREQGKDGENEQETEEGGGQPGNDGANAALDTPLSEEDCLEKIKEIDDKITKVEKDADELKEEIKKLMEELARSLKSKGANEVKVEFKDTDANGGYGSGSGGSYKVDATDNQWERIRENADYDADEEMMGEIGKKNTAWRKKRKEIEDLRKQRQEWIDKCPKPVKPDDTNLPDEDKEYSYNPALWDQIDLTSPPSKRSPPRVFPWWWVAGPVAIVTGTVLILSQDEEEDTPPLPIAANIGLVIDCRAGGSINPTVNDIGRNINITDFDNSSGWVTLQGNTLIISSEAVESFSIAYTITDELGRASSAVVEVTVTTGDPVVPTSITLELEQGEGGLVQVFEFFECQDCSLLGVDPNDAFLTVSSNPSGEINFQLNSEFEGTFSTGYHILDRCRREATGILTIIVDTDPCEIDGEPFVTDATCGLNDGAIVFATEELFGNYNFLIDGELASDTIRNLAPGSYQLRVEVAENPDCFETYELTVNQGDFDILEDVAVSPGNCFTSGGALLSVLSDDLSAYYPEPGLEMELTGQGFNFQSAFPQSTVVDLVQIIEMETGVHPVLGEVTLRIFVDNASDECTQSLSFLIEEEEVDLMVVQDRFTADVGIPLMGNVLLNDTGVGLEVVQVTPIVGVTFDVEPNGMLTFVSESAGIFQSSYTVRDTCGREATANLRIEVAGDPDCELTGDLHITPASCGKDDGAVLLTLQIDNVPNPKWQIGPQWTPEGPLAFVNNQLGTGAFSVNITEIGSDCSLQLNGFVPESPANYITNVITEDATCIQSGDIIVSIMDMPGDFLIQLLNENGDALGEWPGDIGENSLREFTDLTAGTYTVIVTLDGLPERCQSTQSVEISEQELPLLVNDIMVQIGQGEIWMGNVLANDMGTGLQVTGFTLANGGTNSVLPNGMATFTPNMGFSGQTAFMYTARDTCGNESTATVFINVQATDCDITFDLQITPASCGENDGIAQLTLDIVGVASPEWNISPNWIMEGSNVYVRQNMPAGLFSVMVTELTTGCSMTINGEITEELPEFIASVSSTPGSCFVSGNIIVSILDIAGSFSICLFDEANSLIGEWPGDPGPNNLIDFTDLPPGDYTVTVKMIGNPPNCIDSEPVNVEDVAVPFQLIDDDVIIPEGTTWNGNVLLNDIGTGLTVLNHTASPDGQVIVQEDGSSQFIPNPGFTGPTFFMYTALDVCGRTATGLVTITVTPIDCNISGDITSSPASCGKNDGSATVTIQISGVASPSWDLPSGWVQEGDFIFVNDNLPGGNLNVIITEINSGCSVELNTIIEEEAADYILNISSMPSFCIPNGDILVDIMDMPGQYLICLLDEDQNIIGEWPATPGQNSLSEFTDIAAGDYTVIVKVNDLPEHCQSSGAITVEETALPLMVNDDIATINQGEFWSGNILDNDMGTGLIIVAFTQAPNGETSVDAGGDAIFTPNPNFNGVTSFTYTVEDVCGQMSVATVTITVNAADCSFTGNITVTPATCGQEDGTATFNITNWPGACDDGNACDLSIIWSNGATSNPNTNLPAGSYSATVTLEPLGCTDVFNFTVDSEPIDYTSAINATPGNCIDGGNIVISFNNQSAIAPSVNITVIWEGDQVLQTDAPWTEFDLSDFITVFPGNYEIFLLATGLSADCGESINLEVPEVDLPLELPDQMYSIAFGESWTGNVLDNAMGTSLIVSDFTTPPQATLSITLEGNAVLVPNNGFSGVLVFEFTATDICGQMSTAVVTVVVGQPGCFFIQTVSIIPGNCNVGNEAIASLNNPDGLVLTISLTNPENEVFMTMTNGSSIELSSLTDLIGGTYLLEVTEGSCTDQLDFELDDIDLPSLDLLETNPPSAPDAFDGSILLNVSGGSGPYIILVNGDPTGPFPGGLVNLPDLPEGSYELIALDGDECPSQTVDVLLLASLLDNDDNHISILASNYTGWSPLSINQSAIPEHWTPGLRMPEQTELPRDIHVFHGHQVEVGGSFGRDWRFPIRISVGQVTGRILAYQPQSFNPLMGQWRSHYAGISIAPHWKLGGIKGNIQIGGILGHLSGYLAGDVVDFDLQMLSQALRLAPTLQIPVRSHVHIEVGYDLLMTVTTQGNRFNSAPNMTFSATF